MLTTLNGMFSQPKPYKINFIQENKRKLKEISSMVNQNSSRSRLHLSKSKNSQTEINRSTSSSIAFKDSRNLSTSKCKLSTKGSMAVFMHEKKEKGSTSNVSLSTKRKSSHNKVITTKNQSCQTIDPRRCDQLFYDGIIKYPSNKVMQELAEIEKRKANRLDIHVKKEFFKRNKVKQKSSNKIGFQKRSIKVVSEKGDEEDGNATEYEEEDEDQDQDQNQDHDPEENENENDEDEDDEDDDDVNDNGNDNEKDNVNDNDNNKDNEKENEEHENVKESELSERSVISTKVKASPPGLTMCAAEIIRQTTENIKIPGRPHTSDHIPNNKGDSKSVSKSQKPTKEDEIIKTDLDLNCPPGHIPLPDAERKKTLHMLRVSHAELVREMNLLPVRTDTLRVRQKKMQLEAQLNKIEEGIKVFNKSRVYVKIEE